jgi:hypothetical protein
VVNETVGLAKRRKIERKVDFEKAYKSVSWSFLEYMLSIVGFREKWRDWMKCCVCNGNFPLLLVNGCPSKPGCFALVISK